MKRELKKFHKQREKLVFLKAKSIWRWLPHTSLSVNFISHFNICDDILALWKLKTNFLVYLSLLQGIRVDWRIDSEAIERSGSACAEVSNSNCFSFACNVTENFVSHWRHAKVVELWNLPANGITATSLTFILILLPIVLFPNIDF
jgi:hypothetical protein